MAITVNIYYKCVNRNVEHVHSHILFNSVSWRTGKKYRYEKGD